MKHAIWAGLFLSLALVGCAHQQTRLQSAEETPAEKEPEIKTIGDVTSIANADPVSVMGVGLVVGLEGTGGGAPPGGYRAVLEDSLRKKGVENVKTLLNSPNVSLVLVGATIPPGARKGDRVDLEVTLPPQSKTTSLRGGYLKECQLFNYESARNLSETYTGADRALKGHPVAVGEGALLVGVGDGDDAGRLKKARIWGGGVTRLDRPFYLILNSDKQFARMAQAVSDRINERFHGSAVMNEMAQAKSRSVVFVRVPPQYQHNLPRYLRVLRLIPLREQLKALQEDKLGATGAAVAVGTGSAYRKRLQAELMDPTKTVPVALRLEALGEDSIPILKKGLEDESVLVRFSSAEALAYLGSPSCGEELARLVDQQPVLRSFSLTALASLDEAISHVKLRDLLSSPSAEARYGAFRALRALDEREPSIAGEQYNDSFWVHRAVPHSTPMVHMSTSRRPEIVLFGEDPSLLPPFSLLAGEYTITASREDERCTISRFSTKHGTARMQCSLKIADVLKTMAELGAMFPDVVEMLRQADVGRSVSCRVAVDALPQAASIYELAKSATNDPDLLQANAEILEAKADFGATPTLFDKGLTAKRKPEAEPEKKTAEAKD